MNISRYTRIIAHPIETYRLYQAQKQAALTASQGLKQFANISAIDPIANPVAINTPKISGFRKFMEIITANNLKISIGLLLADQVSKYYVRNYATLGAKSCVTFKSLELLCSTHTLNTGAVFGAPADQTILIASSLAQVSLAAVFYKVLSHGKYSSDVHKLGRLALALFMGAHIGNTVDRLLHGGVTDFMLLVPKLWGYVFNLADLTGILSFAIGGYALIKYVAGKIQSKLAKAA